MHEAAGAPEGEYEHICLSAEESLEPEEATALTPSRIEAELRQEHRGRTESALIFDGRYLGVRTEGRGADPGHQLDLHRLQRGPNPPGR